MGETWFTSDYHLGHDNIRKYCKRPFKDLYHMDSTIIKNHNERVKSEDTIYFLGDFCFRNTKGGKDGEGTEKKAEEYIRQLNGRFVFIRGNHDHNNSLNTKIHGIIIEMANKYFYLVHRPEDYEPSFNINLVGHVHESWKFKQLKDGTLLYNVGCDVHNFRPVSFNEIMKNIEEFKKSEKRKI